MGLFRRERAYAHSLEQADKAKRDQPSQPIVIRSLVPAHDLYLVDFGPLVRFSANESSLRDLAKAITDALPKDPK